MAVNLAVDGEGELGRRQFVSDLIAGALQHQFTGGVAISSGDRQLAVLFKDGRPIHAKGPLVPDHRLGEVVLERGVAQQSQVASALAQLESASGTKPLSGALMVKEGLDPAEVKRAVQEQTRRRVKAALSLTEGSWKAAPGENAKMREVGVRTDPLPVLLEDLPNVMSDRELKWAADRWLGKAVRIRDGGPGPLLESRADPALPAVLRYLEKPRKPDQLERATGNRRAVRLALRLLDLLGRLEGLPVAKAVPIPKATLLKGQGFMGYGPSAAAETLAGAPAHATEAPPSSGDLGGATEAAPEPAAPTIDRETEKLFGEIERLHAKMAEQNHFEVLGVKRDTEAADIRQAFTRLARRYHPDALGPNVSEEVATKARELTARLNEASKVLSNEKSRTQYLELLDDERIRGDLRRAERVRDAETKSQMGLVMLRKRDFEEARKLFKLCMESDPVTPTYKAHYAYAMYADRGYDRDKVFEEGYPLLLEALKAAGERDATIHHYTGLFLKERDRMKEALHHFKIAARIEPKNADHRREVRLLQSRLTKDKDDPKKGTGGLGRFFKR